MRFIDTAKTAAPLLLAALGGVGCSSPTSTSASPPPSASVAPAAAHARAPRARLDGSLHPYARPERDLGRMDPALKLSNMSLLFERPPAEGARLARDLVDIQDPASPRYHAWITPAEFGDRYGAGEADIAAARAWLLASGFKVLGAPATRSRLEFEGTIGQVEAAFQTELHRYQVNGARHFAPSRAPTIPASLGTLVAGLHGVNDFRPPPPRFPPGSRRPMISYEGSFALGPADWAAIYDVDALYTAGITGKGQKIAIVGESYYNPPDIVAFRSNFNLDADPMTPNVPTDVLVPNTGSSLVIDPGDVSESELDMEWSGGIAKDASVYFVYTGDSSQNGFFDALVYAVEQPVAPIVSVSYGTCEKGLSPSDAIFYGQVGDLAAMVGVTVLVASGDSGAAGCDDYQPPESAATQGLFVGFPASIPTVVAVGGSVFDFSAVNQSTYWSAGGAALKYIPESVWNDTFVPHSNGLASSGGGYSVIFPRPYWQAGALPASQFRGVPDVVFSASAYTVPYMISESWTVADGPSQTPYAETLVAIGGTSASTPSFAGVVALLNQAIGAPVPGLGNMNPMLYAMNASVPGAFHDTTSGSNRVPCAPGTTDCPVGTNTYGYSATAGYDLATGLGSIDVAKLVNAWSTLAPTSTALAIQGSGGTEGATLTLTATIGSAASGHAMAGDVTFYFQTFDGQNAPDIGYSLGDVPVVASGVDGGVQGATATLMAPSPVGLTGSAQIVAFYGGDKNYLASYSAATPVSTTSTLTVAPPSITLQPNQQTTFTTAGAVPPVNWHIRSDGSCSNFGENCAETTALTATTGGFQAGSGDGTVVLEAIDSAFAEVRITITIAGSPVDGGHLIPVDAGVDAGLDGGVDAGTAPPTADAGQDSSLPASDAGQDATIRGGSKDAGRTDDTGGNRQSDAAKADAAESSPSSGGCAIGGRTKDPDGGMLLALALALGGVPLVRRARSLGEAPRRRA